jgi:hypothetical protein
MVVLVNATVVREHSASSQTTFCFQKFHCWRRLSLHALPRLGISPHRSVYIHDLHPAAVWGPVPTPLDT